MFVWTIAGGAVHRPMTNNNDPRAGGPVLIGILLGDLNNLDKAKGRNQMESSRSQPINNFLI